MSLQIPQEEWNEILECYNELLCDSQKLAGKDEFKSVQKFLAAQELSQWIDKLN